MTLEELQHALNTQGLDRRAEALRSFRDGDFSLEALPLLRQLMTEDHVTLVTRAIECIARLGPEALACPAGQKYTGSGKDVPDELEWQLIVTGGRVWAYSLYPNCYAAALHALMRLEADEDQITEYVHNHIGLVNPDDFLESLKALLAIDTPESRDLAERGITFWRPKLNKTRAKELATILEAS